MRRRQIAGWLFMVLATLTLLATPLRSSFRWRPAFFCEFGAPIERWLAGALNFGHWVAYGLLTLVGAFVFHRRPLARAGALVFGLSAVTELEQAVFVVGHCRVRDLLPNLIAISLAGAGYWALLRLARSKPLRP